MYQLTLSRPDRRAIDWIGHRYGHGEQLYRLLFGACQHTPDEAWDYTGDLTFTIPEHVAWTINEIIEEDQLACFAPDLEAKFRTLQSQIV